MAASKTGLSAGQIIRHMLMNSEGVTTRTDKIYPIVTDKAELPYIVYRRIDLSSTPTKSTGADSLHIEILVFSEKYTEGVELAEEVREALDNTYCEYDGLRMRSCSLENSDESWQDDAYVQALVFNVRI